MNWKIKSAIMKTCSTTSVGRIVYRMLQRASGSIRSNPEKRVPLFLQMADWLENEDVDIKGATIFEVGTGHLTVVPICFFLAGADRIITCDLNKRLDTKLTKETLNWFSVNSDTIRKQFGSKLDTHTFDERMLTLSKYKDDVYEFLRQANIEYRAPADATDTNIKENSIDIHFSFTVLEHIPEKIIKDILLESKRILKPRGVSIHFVDLSDHFEHQDKSITRINFLQFSPKQWQNIAGNEYAYCNRLRPNQYLKIAENVSATVIRSEATVDLRSLEKLKNGFKVDETFQDLSEDIICTRKYNFLLSFDNVSNSRDKLPALTYIYD